MKREDIIQEIGRIAQVNDGIPPGSKLFENKTNLRESAWRGVYWAKWSDALAEAGFAPNRLNEAHKKSDILDHFLRACVQHKRIPTMTELRMYSRQVKGSPSHNTWTRQFGGKSGLELAAKNIAQTSAEFGHLAEIFQNVSAVDTNVVTPNEQKDGWVYLLGSGDFYKIGRSDNLERRVKQISVSLPEELRLVHSISTDDPVGIESYWHNRFSDKRAKGEWFKLSKSDVAIFRKRKFQ